MKEDLKQRLVGAVVLVVLGIIILPLILEKPVTTEDLPEVTDIDVKPVTGHQSFQETPSASAIPSEVIARYEGSDVEGNHNISQEVEQKPQITTSNQIVTEVKSEIANSGHSQNSKNPERKVENKAPEKGEGKSQWVLQIASFSSKENADRLVKRLKSENLSAYFEGVPTSGKTIYRVRIGPIGSKFEIEKLKKQIDQKEKLQTLIVTLE